MIYPKKISEEKKEKVIKEGILTPDLTDFYQSIFVYQNKCYNQYKTISINSESLTSDEMPLIDSEDIPFNDEIISALLQALSPLLTIIEEHHSGMTFNILIDTVSDSKDLVREYTGNLLKGDIEALKRTAEINRIGVDEFIFILVNWLKPMMTLLMDISKDRIDNDEWLMNNCPFCGYFPDMAKLVGSMDGKRFLHCALCGNEWAYKRLCCTICGNEDIDSLGFFQTETETPYRIDYCDKCKGYIKSISISKFQSPDKFDLAVENIVTPHLDSLAMEKGYMRL